MSGAVTALPVTVEQIAIAVKQMSRADQQQLLDLVPNLRQMASQPPARTLNAATANVAAIQKEVLAALDGKPLSPDEPFLNGLTLSQYNALSDEEKGKLWDGWAQVDLMEMKELEVSPDALSAG